MATTKGGIARTNGEGTKPATPVKVMQDYIKSMEGQIAKALPAVITPDRFTRIVFSAISNNKQLALCTPQSFLGAMMQAAQLGLEPNTPLGQAYLIPFRNHGTLECQFQLGYKGLMDLAYRSGQVKDIQTHVVYEHDAFEYELGLEPKLMHKPAMKDRGAAMAYYAIFHTKDGGYGFEVMSIDDVKKHAAAYSQAYKKGYTSPWKTNFDEMAKKTVLKQCLKYAPLKSEFVRAVAADGTIKTGVAKDMLDVHDETDYTDVVAVPVEDTAAPEGQGVPANVDPETGEVLDRKTTQEQEDDAILAASLES